MSSVKEVLASHIPKSSLGGVVNKKAAGDTMKEIVEWLIGMEDEAHKVYERAAMQLKHDREYADLLWRLAEDEKMHYNFMCKAAELVNSDVHPPPKIVEVSSAVKQKAENYFLLCKEKIAANRLTREDIIDFIVCTEFSEWNDMFLYAVNTLKRRHREFIPAAVNIQQHKRYIERFLESKSEFSKFLKEIQLLQRVWQEKILVVDDEEILTDLIAAILEDEGIIETAVNGKEGLKKLGEKYFAAIVTDVDMPVIDGIEFYKKAVEIYPNMKGRFLFFTGFPDEERIAFFRENNLKYLPKPSPIGEIKRAVINIIIERSMKPL